MQGHDHPKSVALVQLDQLFHDLAGRDRVERGDGLVGEDGLCALDQGAGDGAALLLADEPVASLDPVSARKVMELLVELNQRDGMGVIVTLHQVDYAIRYCQRVIALKAGQVAYDGPSSGLDKPTLIEIYGPEIEDAFWEGDTT